MTDETKCLIFFTNTEKIANGFIDALNEHGFDASWHLGDQGKIYFVEVPPEKYLKALPTRLAFIEGYTQGVKACIFSIENGFQEKDSPQYTAMSIMERQGAAT